MKLQLMPLAMGALMGPLLRVARLHRPSPRHFSTVLASAIVVAGGVHLFIQGIS